MKLDAWKTKLKTECPAFSQRVKGAAELAAIKKDTGILTPCAFVIPLTDQVKSQIVGNCYTELTTVTIGVVAGVRNVADARGESAQLSLEPVRSAIKQALCGWQPAGATLPIRRLRGSLLSYNDQILYYVDVFTTQTSFRKRLNP